MKVGVALADVIAGKDAAIAVLAALAAIRGQARGERRSAGDGRESGGLPAAQRHLMISLAHSAAAALVNVAQNALVTGREGARWGNAHPNLVPYQLFDAADRPIVVAVGSDPQWRACALALELPALADDPRFATNAGRLEHRASVVAALAARLRERPAAEWLDRLDQAGVPAGRVKSVLETLAEVDTSALTGVAPSVPGSVRLPPPTLDEHGALVRAAGWGAFREAGSRVGRASGV